MASSDIKWDSRHRRNEKIESDLDVTLTFMGTTVNAFSLFNYYYFCAVWCHIDGFFVCICIFVRKNETLAAVTKFRNDFSFLIKSNKLLGISYNLLNREIKVHVFIVTASVNNWINFYFLSPFVVTSAQFTERKQPLQSLQSLKK